MHLGTSPISTGDLSATLSELARQVRRWTLESIYHAGSGHPGGALSAVDLMLYLFTQEMRFDPEDAENPSRDRFVLSKGHACPALYAVAALVGLLPVQELRALRKLNGRLQGHPHRLTTPWVEASTGSLGQGFSFAIGQALGLRYQERPSRVYVMLGDGELQEGEVWEGAMCAGHYKLDNLCAVIDYNKLQSDDANANIMTLEPLVDKWRAFNWHVEEIDGHDFGEMAAVFQRARTVRRKPTVVVAHTVKGKGVSFMEGAPAWHGSLKLRKTELEQALRELAPRGKPAEENAYA